ncbi:MAG TPA: hypothetical protein VFR58_00120 [Flavisolibacter sp.]|nr:hypothetical protein [Flavisolibacter sp.]
MRKVILNKWFFLALLLMVSLSAFSVIAYKEARSICNVTDETCGNSSRPADKGEMLWDVLSRQFSSVSIR